MQALEADDPQQVGGYRLLARLGAGGMGRVYLARSRGGRRVALKVIRAELADDPDFRARFAREVASARAVGGAFTVAVLDADAQAETPWLATEYVAGPSLSEAVREHGPLPADSVRALAAGLAEALVAIHRAGVIHRDLKPSNVLLASDGPRVIDFGISRAVEATELTRTGVIVGSPGFMSPEQIEGHQVTPATDVFSLGAVLAFAASGAGPFGEGSAPSLLYRVVHSEPRLDAVPEELRGLVGSCLAKDPVSRPGPDALLDRLEAEEGEEPHAPTEMWLPAGLTGMIARVEAERPSALNAAAGASTAAKAAAASGAAASETAETVPVPVPAESATPPMGFGPPPPAGFGPAPVLAAFAAEGAPTVVPAPSAPVRTTAAGSAARPRRKAPMIIAAALLLAVAGTGIALAALNRNDSSGKPEGASVAPTTAPATVSASATPSDSASASDSASGTGQSSTAAAVYLTVPTVTGQPVDYAKQLLTDKGFHGGSIKVRYHCTQAGPGVYAQSPSAGSRVAADSLITLTASEDDCIAYQSEVGLPLATAQADLKGFSKVTVTYSCAGGAAGTVLAQSPAATPEASYPPSQPIALTVQGSDCGSASATASATP
ncbi:protein kinase domain-containing protein [Streptacidiphilus alkalitolerans]|uniref:protein kinase domain-containing protein n=1 Tax=Streptacidiphilus alkalitolerans TaxID=3342712 RepID=UPI0036D3521F